MMSKICLKANSVSSLSLGIISFQCFAIVFLIEQLPYVTVLVILIEIFG